VKPSSALMQSVKTHSKNRKRISSAVQADSRLRTGNDDYQIMMRDESADIRVPSRKTSIQQFQNRNLSVRQNARTLRRNLVFKESIIVQAVRKSNDRLRRMILAKAYQD